MCGPGPGHIPRLYTNRECPDVINQIYLTYTIPRVSWSAVHRKGEKHHSEPAHLAGLEVVYRCSLYIALTYMCGY